MLATVDCLKQTLLKSTSGVNLRIAGNQFSDVPIIFHISNPIDDEWGFSDYCLRKANVWSLFFWDKYLGCCGL